MSYDQQVLLAAILERCLRIRRYVLGMSYDRFLADEKTRDAVERNLEVIGEAVKKVSAAFKAHHAHVPWRDISGMRDRLIHDFLGVDYEIVWNAVQRDLPALEAEMRRVRTGR
jgi:uncharacterized protein with HEPN domain